MKKLHAHVDTFLCIQSFNFVQWFVVHVLSYPVRKPGFVHVRTV
jgi:hypothetical protein